MDRNALLTRGRSQTTRAQFVRFVAVGAANTLSTLLLWLLLAQVLDLRLAYTIAFLIGVAVTTWATSAVVFGAALTARRGAAFVGWYLAVYATGLLIVHLVSRHTSLPDPVIAGLTLGVTAPMSFLGGRLIFGRQQEREL